MNLTLQEAGEIKIAKLTSQEHAIEDVQDALDLMADAFCLGAQGIIIHENNLTSAFFDLKTGVAGEILQKFSNYNVSMAIIGDFEKYASKSLHDFIFESNKNMRILFVDSEEEAVKMLSGN